MKKRNWKSFQEFSKGIEKYNNIIWDFDGTIVELDFPWKQFKNQLRVKYELSLEKGLWKAIDSSSKDDRVAIMQEIGSFEGKIVKFNKWKPLAHITELIRVHGANKRFFIFSTNNKNIISEILYTMDLIQYFEDIIGCTEVEKHKPDPEGILYLINNYNLKKEETIFIGDSLVDREAGLRADINVFLIWS